jgi:hypothetical protein
MAFVDFKYGGDNGIVVPLSRFPETTNESLLKRAIGHIMVNEASAHITAQNLKRSRGGLPALTEAEADVIKNEFRARKIDQMVNGQLGYRASAEPVDPVGAEVWRLATKELGEVLKAHNAKLPRGEDENGNPRTLVIGGTAYTAEQLVQAYIDGVDKGGAHGSVGAPNAPRLQKMAEKTVRDSQARAKKNAEAAKAAPGLTGLSAIL